jgi:hypothetical protein
MCEQKDTSAEMTNHFTDFLANGDDYYQCIYNEESVTVDRVEKGVRKSSQVQPPRRERGVE